MSFDFSLKVFAKKRFLRFRLTRLFGNYGIYIVIYMYYISIYDERLVWGSLRLAPIIYMSNACIIIYIYTRHTYVPSQGTV